MNWETFERIIEPMRTKFGKNAFDPQKLGLIFEECRDIENDDFRKIVNEFIGEDVRAKVSDFADKAREYRHRRARVDQSDHRCQYCGDGAWIVPEDLPDNSGVNCLKRCECVGGWRPLISTYRNSGDKNLRDPGLADRLEDSVLWMDQYPAGTWKQRGYSIFMERRR